MGRSKANKIGKTISSTATDSGLQPEATSSTATEILKSEDYVNRRAKNNLAVKKSREKAKSKKAEQEKEMDLLRSEIASLQKEDKELDERIQRARATILHGKKIESESKNSQNSNQV